VNVWETVRIRTIFCFLDLWWFTQISHIILLLLLKGCVPEQEVCLFRTWETLTSKGYIS